MRIPDSWEKVQMHGTPILTFVKYQILKRHKGCSNTLWTSTDWIRHCVSMLSGAFIITNEAKQWPGIWWWSKASNLIQHQVNAFQFAISYWSMVVHCQSENIYNFEMLLNECVQCSWKQLLMFGRWREIKYRMEIFKCYYCMCHNNLNFQCSSSYPCSHFQRIYIYVYQVESIVFIHHHHYYQPHQWRIARYIIVSYYYSSWVMSEARKAQAALMRPY